MRNNTRAIPIDRIQLSNHRPNRVRRRSGTTGPPDGMAPGTGRGPPKSCMQFTLQRRGARRNRHRPFPLGRPAAYPVAKHLGGSRVGDPGREAGRVALSLDAHPGGPRVLQRIQRVGFDRRAVAGEQDQQTLVRHAPIVASRRTDVSSEPRGAHHDHATGDAQSTAVHESPCPTSTAGAVCAARHAGSMAPASAAVLRSSP